MDESTVSSKPSDVDEVNVDYANNTMFEPTVWDLKLIFGEYSQRSQSVEFHTSVTVPWAQAKLIMYYLQANVAVYESSNGKIKIPPAVLPQEWTPPTPEEAKRPESQELFEKLKTLREELIKSSM